MPDCSREIGVEPRFFSERAVWAKKDWCESPATPFSLATSIVPILCHLAKKQVRVSATYEWHVSLSRCNPLFFTKCGIDMYRLKIRVSVVRLIERQRRCLAFGVCRPAWPGSDRIGVGGSAPSGQLRCLDSLCESIRPWPPFFSTA